MIIGIGEEIMRRLLGNVSFILLLAASLASCGSKVPGDFWMVVDARLAPHLQEVPTEQIYLEISADGRGSYLLYDTGGVIVHDPDGMVSISSNQIREEGKFTLTRTQMGSLVQSLQDSDFFNLTEDYRMSIGGAYAFLVVTIDGQSHIVDNIGMRVGPVEKIIDALNGILPSELEMEYYAEGIWDY
jgi:predicted small lipoprotein YifL